MTNDIERALRAMRDAGTEIEKLRKELKSVRSELQMHLADKERIRQDRDYLREINEGLKEEIAVHLRNGEQALKGIGEHEAGVALLTAADDVFDCDERHDYFIEEVLFLDDCDERHDYFKTIIPGHVTVRHVWTVCHAILALQETKFDCVWLDHDLEESDPLETGKSVAQFIALHQVPEFRPTKVVIHSWNPEGAKEMKAIIDNSNLGIEVILKPFKV